MPNRLLLLMALLSSQFVNAQDSDCKVALPAISGTYSGGCKSGLAQGKGIAQGIDHYEGQFDKGMPEGKGTYTWADGSYYEGQWKEGVKEGKGKMVYKDSTVKGFWKNGKYVGEKLVPAFKVMNTLSVTRYNIAKTSNIGNEVRIKILQAGSDNMTIEDLSLAYDSGQEYRMGSNLVIQNVLFPLDMKIKYRCSNLFRTSQFNVIFEFAIFEAGTWEVTITN
jgi:hypothetical protein